MYFHQFQLFKLGLTQTIKFFRSKMKKFILLFYIMLINFLVANAEDNLSNSIYQKYCSKYNNLEECLEYYRLEETNAWSNDELYKIFQIYEDICLSDFSVACREAQRVKNEVNSKKKVVVKDEKLESIKFDNEQLQKQISELKAEISKLKYEKLNCDDKNNYNYENSHNYEYQNNQHIHQDGKITIRESEYVRLLNKNKKK